MASLAVIPARGGSKRIHRKNIKSFLGKPIITYSINAAIESELFDEIMVSTDDYEISEISKLSGAKVPFFRSSETSDDFATTVDVINEVVNKYHSFHREFDNICCIYPCAPFVTAAKLTETFKIFERNKFTSLVPIVKYSNPIERSLILNDGKVRFKFDKNALARSQDFDISYFDAGQFYWFKPDEVLNIRSIYTDNAYGFEISEMEAQDIDNEMDWELAEMKYKLINKNNQNV